MPTSNSTDHEAHAGNGAGLGGLVSLSNGALARPSVPAEGTVLTAPGPDERPTAPGDERYFGLPEALLAGVASVAALAVAYAYERAYAIGLGAPDILVQVDTAGVLRTLGPAFLGLLLATVLLLVAATGAMWRLLHAVAIASAVVHALLGIEQRDPGRVAFGVVVGAVLLVLPRAASWTRQKATAAGVRYPRFTDKAQRAATGLLDPWVRRSTEASTELDRSIGGIAAMLRPGGARLAGAALLTGVAMIGAITVAELRVSRQTRWAIRDAGTTGRPALALIRRYGDRVLTAPIGPDGCLVPRFSLQPIDSLADVHAGTVRSVRECRAQPAKPAPATTAGHAPGPTASAR